MDDKTATLTRKLTKHKPRVDDLLTPREREFVTRAVDFDSMASLCASVGISRSRGYKVLANVKRKWRLAAQLNGWMVATRKNADRRHHWLSRSLLILRPPEGAEEAVEMEAALAQ